MITFAPSIFLPRSPLLFWRHRGGRVCRVVPGRDQLSRRAGDDRRCPRGRRGSRSAWRHGADGNGFPVRDRLSGKEHHPVGDQTTFVFNPSNLQVGSDLQKGALTMVLKNLVNGAAGDHSFFVRTPTAAAGVRGTSFFMKVEDAEHHLCLHVQRCGENRRRAGSGTGLTWSRLTTLPIASPPVTAGTPSVSTAPLLLPQRRGHGRARGKDRRVDRLEQRRPARRPRRPRCDALSAYLTVGKGFLSLKPRWCQYG